MVCASITPPAHRALQAHLAEHRKTTVEAYLRPLIDIKEVAPPYVGPPLPPGTDIWGVCRSPVSYGPGSYNEIAFYPLGNAADPSDVAAHRWPSTEWFDYAALPDRIADVQKGGECCLMVGNGNIFETTWYMRGFERTFMDLALNPELAHAIFERVCSFYVAHFTRVLAAARGGIDLIFTADDIAGQNGLLMSLDMWSQHIKPYHQKLNRAIHEFGARVIYHSDGAVQDAVSGLMDMGIDVLQALQFDARGMDPGALKANHGHALCFAGGISVQKTLPFGTPDDVRREVQERIAVLGKDGGYILGPSHAIQAGTPPENIVALFDTAAACPMPSAGGGDEAGRAAAGRVNWKSGPMRV
jgi:uroporphyrinogen decarboxylase